MGQQDALAPWASRAVSDPQPTRKGARYICELPPGHAWMIHRHDDGGLYVESESGLQIDILPEPQDGYRLIDGVPHFNGIPLKVEP